MCAAPNLIDNPARSELFLHIGVPKMTWRSNGHGGAQRDPKIERGVRVIT